MTRGLTRRVASRRLTSEFIDLITQRVSEYIEQQHRIQCPTSSFYQDNGRRGILSFGRRICVYVCCTSFDETFRTISDTFKYSSNGSNRGIAASLATQAIESRRESDPILDKFLTDLENEIFAIRRQRRDKAEQFR